MCDSCKRQRPGWAGGAGGAGEVQAPSTHVADLDLRTREKKSQRVVWVVWVVRAGAGRRGQARAKQRACDSTCCLTC